MTVCDRDSVTVADDRSTYLVDDMPLSKNFEKSDEQQPANWSVWVISVFLDDSQRLEELMDQK